MTSLERVLCALHGEKADRRAFTLTLSLYGAALSGCPVREYYSNPVRYLEGQQCVVREVNPDVLFSPFVLPFEALAYGGEAVWLDRFPPNVRKPPFRTPDQIEALDDKLITSAGIAYLLEATHLMAKEYGGQKPVCAVITAPVDLPAILLGIESWLEVLLFDPEHADALLALALDHFSRISAAFFAAGAAFVVSPVMFANTRLVTSAMLHDRILPVLDAAFATCPGPLVFHHGGNRIQDHLAVYSNLSNVAGFVIDPRDDLEQARNILGPERLMLGNLNGPALARKNPDIAYAETTGILAGRKNDLRFILASGHADVPFDTSLATLQAVSRAVSEAGGAPCIDHC